MILCSLLVARIKYYFNQKYILLSSLSSYIPFFLDRGYNLIIQPRSFSADPSVLLPFCTPVFIGPHVVALLSFNRFSVGSKIRADTRTWSSSVISCSLQQLSHIVQKTLISCCTGEIFSHVLIYFSILISLLCNNRPVF